ncbi:hypothetical protein AWW66_03440 [Micromonospora rosaria]|uniref:Uncharacterized protein n=1 Tax=Micromonospora rosaria TaxID=47874 RepID=A0A136PY23_9ACTN|nr:hypothetical protein AWW66_03440 [Micromonospora rosaria]
MTAAVELTAPTDTGRCGERAGYVRHRRAGEHPCEPCRRASSTSTADYRSRIRRRGVSAIDRRIAEQALPLTSGRLATTQIPHRFRPLTSSTCAECWGFRDDPRHPLTDGPVVGR